jgi:hypothetical protein
MNLLVGKHLFVVHGVYDHRRIDFKNQQFAALRLGTVDTDVLKACALANCVQRIMVACGKISEFVQEAGFLSAFVSSSYMPALT